MRREYINDFEQMTIMLPKREKAALKREMSLRKMTQLDLIRGAYRLLKDGKYDEFFGIEKSM